MDGHLQGKMKKKKCRCKTCVAFRKEHDFEFLDIYGLYYTIAKFLVPRLTAFKKATYSFPVDLTFKQWKGILNKMIFAFDKIAKENRDDKYSEKIAEGLELYSKYFYDLLI